jgi:hypothetical protein
MSKAQTNVVKLRSVVSVKDFPYLAKGDGVTDDTAAFQSCMAANLNIYIPPGTYVVSAPLVLRTGHRVVGAGRTVTKLKSAVVLDSLFKTTATYVGFVYMSDMELRGNGLTGASGNGHALNLIDAELNAGAWSPAQCIFDRLYIRDFRGTDTRNGVGTMIDAAAVICVDGLGNVWRDISISNCGYGYYLQNTQNCRIIETLITACTAWGVQSYDNENLTIIGGDINNSGTDGVTNATGAPETGLYTGNVCSARDEHFTVTGLKTKGSPGIAQVHLFTTSATLREGWYRPSHYIGEVDIAKVYSGVLVTNPVDVTIDGIDFSPAVATFSLTYATTHIKLTVASTHNIGKVRVVNNRFRTQGSVLTAACVHLKGTTGSTRMEGLEVSGNSFGTNLIVSSAVTINADVLLDTGAFKNCRIEGNNHYDATNVTKVAHYVATSATFDASNELRLNSFSSQVTGVIAGIYTGLVASDAFGIWTPTLEGLSVTGAGTYSTRKGTYVKRGKTVKFSCALTWTAHTGTGSMRISGLPFATKNDSGLIFPHTILSSDLTFAGTLAAASPVGVTYINLYTMASNTAVAGLSMDTTGTVWVSGEYEVD